MPKKLTSYRLPADVLEWLAKQDNATDAVEKALRMYMDCCDRTARHCAKMRRLKARAAKGQGMGKEQRCQLY